jgi:hypothetical protein
MRPEPDPQQPSVQMDRRSRRARRHPAVVARSRALVVACRTTAWSSAQATKAVAAVIRQGGQIAVVAVVTDGWPEPCTVTSRLRLLEPGRHSGESVVGIDGSGHREGRA